MGKPQREVDPFRNELLTLRQALGRRIRELRTARGWSQEQFADMAHIHRTFAGSLERGEKNCSFHALVLIARCFGITMAELLAGIDGGAVPQARRVRKDSSLERGRILGEAERLERTVKVLREIALAEPQATASRPVLKKR